MIAEKTCRARVLNLRTYKYRRAMDPRRQTTKPVPKCAADYVWGTYGNQVNQNAEAHIKSKGQSDVAIEPHR
jgi:hypothetical protein